MNPDFIVISNLLDVAAICSYFDSSMVDVAYATPIDDKSIKIEVESTLDLRDHKTLSWLSEIIQDILKKYQETSAIMVIQLKEV